MKEPMKENNNVDMEAKQPIEDKVNGYEFRHLENQVKQLQKAVRDLTVISDILAKKNEIKIERYIDLMVVSRI